MALFAGLEHEHHVAAQVFTAFGEEHGRADEPGRVQVVTAGVHGARGPRPVVHPRLLGDGEGVHVAAEQHGAAGPTAAQDRRHGAEVLAEGDVQRKTVEGREDLLLGAGQLESELGFAVQGAPQPGQFGLEFLGAFRGRHAG